MGDDHWQRILEKDYAKLDPQEQLLRACHDGSCDRIEGAIAAGASVRTRVNNPIRFAAAKGHTDAVRLLLRHGASIEPEFLGDCTILREAIVHNHIDIVTLLVAAGAKIKGRVEPMLIAAKWGHWDMVQLLIDLGASVKTGKNAIIREAAILGDAQAVQLLLSFGAYLKDPKIYGLEVQAVVENYVMKTRLLHKVREGNDEGMGL